MNQSTAICSRILPETGLEWPRSRRCPLGCSRLGRRNFLSFKPRFPVDSSVTNHFCRPAWLQGFPIHQVAWVQGFPIPQEDRLTSRLSLFIRQSQRKHSWCNSSAGSTVSRFTSGGHHDCISGPVSCMTRPLLLRSTLDDNFGSPKSSELGAARP